MLSQIIVTAKIYRDGVIEVIRQTVPVHNDYEIEVFVDDLNLSLSGVILETEVRPLVASVN